MLQDSNPTMNGEIWLDHSWRSKLTKNEWIMVTSVVLKKKFEVARKRIRALNQLHNQQDSYQPPTGNFLFCASATSETTLTQKMLETNKSSKRFTLVPP